MGFIESHFAEFLNGGAPVTPENFQRGRLFCVLAGDTAPLAVHLSAHQKSWEALTRVVERPDILANHRFATYKDRSENHEEILMILQEAFQKKPRAEWLKLLDEADVSSAPIYSAGEVFEDPQVKHLGLPREISHPVRGVSKLIGNGVNLSDTPAQFLRAAPLLGENTDEILKTLGFDETAIETLRADGAV